MPLETGYSNPVEARKSFRILPAGSFQPVDGRLNGRSWLLTEARGKQLVQAALARQSDYLIDYEHQSLNPTVEAPAAGWFSALEWRDDGLYVTDARWNDRAKALIESKEYRFISPVFRYDGATLEVSELIGLAVTNNPALHGLTDLSYAAAASALTPDVGAPDVMSERDRQAFEHIFGATVQELAAATAVPPAPPPPEGMNQKDWDTMRHSFPGVFDGH